jgi:hypothetical protein
MVAFLMEPELAGIIARVESAVEFAALLGLWILSALIAQVMEYIAAIMHL